MDFQSSFRNAFEDHVEEFIRAQRGYQREHESRKIERINIPNARYKERAPVIKHTIEVIHINQSDQMTNKISGKKKTNYSRESEDSQQSHQNRKVDSSDETGIKHLSEENNKGIFKHTQKKTTTSGRLFEFKSNINKCEKRSLFEQSQDGTDNYSVISKQITHFKSSRDINGIKQKRSLLIYYGQEISDTIVGSYSAMNMFLSFYNEWKNLRAKALKLFEDITKNLTDKNASRNKTRNVFELIGKCGRMVSNIPDPRVSLPASIIASISEFFGKLFGSTPNLKDSGINEFELIKCLEEDIGATSDMNIFGIQCDQNFQETSQKIEEFHKSIQGWCFEEITEGLDTDFLEDISKLNPKNHIVFYRRLQKWLERLAGNSSSDISKAFSRGFEDFPEALPTTNLLHWRYHSHGIDEAVNLRSWDEIRGLLQNGDSVAVVDIVKKIQDCMLVLIKERSAMERDVMELLQNETNFDFKKKEI